MRAVVQRVGRCKICVDDVIVSSCGRGLLIYLGVGIGDSRTNADFIVAKSSSLRIFEDADGQMNLSASDVDAEICVVSQFTLYANTRKGRRPSFTAAADPVLAHDLYDYVIEAFRSSGYVVATGRFGAHMLVEYVNDGPVTIILDSDNSG